MSFVWMPLIMMFAEQLFRPRGEVQADTSGEVSDSAAAARGTGLQKASSILLALAGLAFSYGAFLWSHPPTAYQFSMTVGVFLPLLALTRRDWKGLVLSGLGLALGLAVSAAYLLAAAREQELIRHEFVAENWPYHESYVFIHTEYIDRNWSFFNLINNTWLVQAAAIVICFLAVLLLTYRFKGSARSVRTRAIVWGVPGCFASFMMTRASYSLGVRIPKIDIGVFSWRMLSITTLMAALLIGLCAQAGLEAYRQRKRLRSYVLGGIAALALAGGIAFTVIEVVAPVWSNPLFQPESEHLNLAIIPRTAPSDPEDLPEVDPVELDQENGSVRVERWDPQHREIAVDLEEPDQVWIRTFSFPGWTATVDGSPAKIVIGEELGDMTIEVGPGSHQIVLDYLETPVRRQARIITLMTFIVLIASTLISLAMVARARVFGSKTTSPVN